MKKIFLLLILLVSVAFSAIDECKTDVYFANGILTGPADAQFNTGLLEEEIKQKFGIDYYNKHIGKVDYAYNHTYGQIPDLAESLNQILNETYGKPNLFDSDMRQLLNQLVKVAHDADLKLQVEKYEESIKDGHKVLVVAHSQGNLFTREAYLQLGKKSKNAWMQNYFAFFHFLLS